MFWNINPTNFSCGKKTPKFKFSRILLYMYIYTHTSKLAYHWLLWLVCENGGRYWKAWWKIINHDVDNFKSWWVPWRKGTDSCNACYRKWMLTLEAECFLEYCCSEIISSVILGLTALSRELCTQTGAQVRCTHSRSEKRVFLWSSEITPRRPLEVYWCSVNSILKIQRLSPCIITTEA